MDGSRARRLPRPILVYAAVVAVNYGMQVPYALDLYGLRFSRGGVLLLGATLAWFLVAIRLYAAGLRFGRVVLFSYAFVQLGFYAHSALVLTAAGYGLPYQLTHAHDAIVWLTFLAGGANLAAAAAIVVWLVAHRGHAAGGAKLNRTRG